MGNTACAQTACADVSTLHYTVNLELTENYKEKCHVRKESNTTVNVITPSLPIHLQRRSKCQQEDFLGGEEGGGGGVIYFVLP